MMSAEKKPLLEVKHLKKIFPGRKKSDIESSGRCQSGYI